MTDDACTILVVEDDTATRTFLADNLTADGYEVLVSDCARDALRLLETKGPTSLLLDLGLPDVSGLDVLRRLRAADGVASRMDPGTPVLLLTGRAGEVDRLRGFDCGADDYVPKPFSYQEVRGADRRAAAPLPGAQIARAHPRRRTGDRSRRAHGAAARHAGRAVAEGVRAAARPGRRAVARVVQGGAAADRLGLPEHGSRPGPSTRTPAACDASSASTATTTS